MKSICFLIHGTAPKPVGGVKVVYEYANMFVEKGYKVSVLFGEKRKNKESLLELCKDFVKFICKKLMRFDKKQWFLIDNRVSIRYVFDFTTEFYSYDVLIATMLSTSYHLAEARKKNCTKCMYFVQGFETWNVSESYVLNSYKLNLRKIAISPWLFDKIKSVDSNVVYIPNGFDFDYFSLQKPIERRDKFAISMLYHTNPQKRCLDLFEALLLLKQKYPQLHVNMFGAYPKPNNLPDWYSYIRKPNKNLHNDLYNSSAIFLNASEQEGWGLTVGEAMICGCAVVCSNNDGHLIMAKDKETALVFEVGEIQQIVSCIERLFNDDVLRQKIAYQGNVYIQQFSWKKSLEKFISVIEEKND